MINGSTSTLALAHGVCYLILRPSFMYSIPVYVLFGVFLCPTCPNELLVLIFKEITCLVQIPFQLVGRLWDTWLSEADNFTEYLVYVCASFLLTVSPNCSFS